MSKTKKLRAASLYGAALIADNMPLNQRLDILSKYIQPKPGSEIYVEESSAKDYGPKDNERGLLTGIIVVTPPKGSCFNITTDPDRSDIQICKKTPMRWRLQDLDRHTGKLNWTIKTGPGDFGTPLEWKTNYIIAKIIPSKYQFEEANSTPVFIKSCRAIAAEPETGKGRRIELTLFSGKKWLIRFPDVDKEIPPPEPPPPPPTKEEKKKDDHGGHGGDEHGGGHGDEHGAPKPTPAPTPTPPPPEAWTMSTRRGFEMDVSGFLTNVSMPPGTKGKCRYQYDAVIGNFDMGRIECHYSDDFTYFYAPLPCMKYLQKNDPQKK